LIAVLKQWLRIGEEKKIKDRRRYGRRNNRTKI